MVWQRRAACAGRCVVPCNSAAAAAGEGGVTATISPGRRHLGFKCALYALLAGNTAYYVVTGTLSEAIDAVAWLALLTLFALETGLAGRLSATGAVRTVRGLRLMAAAAVSAAAIGYLRDGAWLDLINTGLWIAVIVLLELDVRQSTARPRRPWIRPTLTVLYAGLGGLVLIWAWRAEWFDAYDALLWLAAFAMIEMQVLQISRLPTPVAAEGARRTGT